MSFLNDIISLIDISIRDDAGGVITSGNIIKQGYDDEVDNLKDIQENGHIWIVEYQKKLIGESKISSLKIKYTQNLGYFIELTKVHGDSVPEYFILKQSLLQVHRYTTVDLQDFEKSLISASDILLQKEYEIFINIRDIISLQFSNLYSISRKVEYLDFITNGSFLSLSRHYTCPIIHQTSMIDIDAGRHPVLSTMQRDFISNDLFLDHKQYIHLITGPNMGGKSTFLRQNALLILMTHIGYHIPAKQANIGIVDKLFSRVGSGDNLFLGQSTFMVEMQEISYILRNATKKSFIIIDEIGRGTGTQDGMSLAWSILQYIHNSLHSKTLFATHYHEIIVHSQQLKGVKNFSVAVGENSESIVFLRKIILGGMKKSYGIEVAQLAGIPEEVVQSAKKLLYLFQQNQQAAQLQLGFQVLDNIKYDTTEYNKIKEIIDSIESINLNELSPVSCLLLLSQFQEQIKKIK